MTQPNKLRSYLFFKIICIPVILVITLLQGLPALAQNACGDPFRNHFGPWDYRTATKYNKDLVEGAHFTPGIESLSKPKTTSMRDMAQDVAYTLAVFPNHPRALLTMTKLSEKYKSDPPPGINLSVECFFDRAVRFTPDDTVVRNLYALYLGQRNRKDDAIKQLEFAQKQAADNPISQYNIGVVFLELGEFDRALAQAHKANALGLQWLGLEESLKKTGRWTPPAQE